MFVKVQNGEIAKFPYSVGALRRDNPNTSFPKHVPEATMVSFGMFPVEYADDPAHDPETQRVEQSSAPVLQDGRWIITKSVVDLTAEQLEELRRAKASSIRARRDKLLSASDWKALSDTTLTPEWAAYRQALRDITDQDGFPYDIVWPEKPE